MKKLFIALMIGLCLTVAGNVLAKDIMLDTEIKTMTVANDKNGNEYVRFIIEEPRSLNGVEYTDTVAVMAFGSTVADAKELSEGDGLKAIASQNEYRGRTNYNIIKILQ